MRDHKFRIMALLLGAIALVQFGIIVGQLLPVGQAQADPIGMSVDGGSSPRVSLTGEYASGSWSTIYTVPDGYELVITDIHVQGRDYTGAYDCFRMYDPDANRYLFVGWWGINWGYTDARPVEWHSETGLIVPSGHRLQISVWKGYQNAYTIVGFLARS